MVYTSKGLVGRNSNQLFRQKNFSVSTKSLRRNALKRQKSNLEEKVCNQIHSPSSSLTEPISAPTNS